MIGLNCQLEDKRQHYFELEVRCKSLREEIDHLTRSGSLIPQRIYEIKERAIQELSIPAQDLIFFAELVQVKEEFQKFRKPVEAVFFGVSRNLLCHPKYLNKLTKWLDRNGFRADVTVKRISETELNDNIEVNFDYEENGILNYIEILPEEKHPFTNYIKIWCHNSFNYKLVDVSEFKGKKDHLVTIDGLIKSDNKTMRKLKSNFSYSLGWDTQNVIAEKSRELAEKGCEYQNLRNTLAKVEQQNSSLSTELTLIDELLNSPDEIELLGAGEVLKQQTQQLKGQLEQLKVNQPEYKALQEQLEKKQKSEQNLRQKIAACTQQLQERTKRIDNTNKVLPQREESFLTSNLFVKFIEIYHSPEDVCNVLKVKSEELTKQGISRIEKSSDLREQLKGLENRRGACTAKMGSYLQEHKRNFSDPGVSYQLTIEGIEELN